MLTASAAVSASAWRAHPLDHEPRVVSVVHVDAPPHPAVVADDRTPSTHHRVMLVVPVALDHQVVTHELPPRGREHAALAADASGSWKWTRVLIACRRGDAPDKIAELVAEARSRNPHVPDFLLGRRQLPDAPPPYIQLGGETEAAVYAASDGRAWADSPSALRQLQRHGG
jgi:hypothetical protein